MSGLEVAGVVLGSIPLVIAALEHYKAGKGAAAAFVQWRGQLDTLIFRLKLQRTFFFLHIQELLRNAGIEEVVDRTDLTEEECVAILKNAQNGKEVRVSLGQLYEPVLEILGRYETCLKTLVGKLGNIRRLPNAEIDDLAAMLAANPSEKSRFAFRERLTFTIERGSLKKLVEELSEDRLSLKTIVTSLKTQQEHTAKVPSHEAKKLTRLFSEVRRNANPLFTAMCKGCICSCKTKHKVLMRLDNRLSQQPSRRKLVQKSREQTTFHLFFDLEGSLQESLVRAIQSEEPSPIKTRSSFGVDRSRTSTVIIPSFTVTTPDEPNFEDTQTAANICQHASKAHLAGCVLRLELSNEKLTVFEGRTEQRRQFSDSITLDNLLTEGHQDEDARLTPKQQTLLALDLAASIIQLRQTCWFEPAFNNQTVKFLVQKSQQVVLSMSGPYVERIMDYYSAEDSRSSIGPDPKGALLELAILLLEIWHHKPIEIWSAKTGIKSLKSPEARRIAAIRWLEKTADRLPVHHLTAIEQCLAICSGRLRAWDDEEFLRHYCENIIRPLQESCKAW